MYRLACRYEIHTQNSGRNMVHEGGCNKVKGKAQKTYTLLH